MRLFVAIDFPDHVKHALASLKSCDQGFRWVSPEQLHLTLQFLGEVGGEKLETLSGALSLVRGNSISLEFIQPGFFPGRGKPRVLWVGIRNNPDLERLSNMIRHAVAGCGIELEKRPFRPHVTLARMTDDVAPGRLKQVLEAFSGVRLPSMTATEFVLFRSVLAPQGAIHHCEGTYPLSL